MKLGQNVCLDEIPIRPKMGHVRSKTGSLDQTLEKPCVHSRGHIFSPIIMKFEMFVLMKSRTSSKMGYVWTKTRSYIRKTLCTV